MTITVLIPKSVFGTWDETAAPSVTWQGCRACRDRVAHHRFEPLNHSMASAVRQPDSEDQKPERQREVPDPEALAVGDAPTHSDWVPVSVIGITANGVSDTGRPAR
jgi:hypothetical protein